MRRQFAAIMALLMIGSIANAAPTVTGNVISWPNDGYYQVQRSSYYGTYNVNRCEGARSCAVIGGKYSVIKLAPGPVQRFDGIVVDHGEVQVNGNSLIWNDDGWYQVQRIDKNGITNINRCEGASQSCTVGPGKYSVIRLAPGPVKRFDGLEVTKSLIDVRMSVVSWPDNGVYQVQDALTNAVMCSGGQSCSVEPGTYNVTNVTDNVTYKNIEVAESSVFSDVLGLVPVGTLDAFYETVNNWEYDILDGTQKINSSIACSDGGSLTLHSRTVSALPASLESYDGLTGYAYLTANACADRYGEITGKLYIGLLESKTDKGNLISTYTLSDGYVLDKSTNEMLRFGQMPDGRPSIFVSKISNSSNLKTTRLYRDYRLNDIEVLNPQTGLHSIGHLNYRTAAVRFAHGEFRTQFTMNDASKGYKSYKRTYMEKTYDEGVYGGNKSITSINLAVTRQNRTQRIYSSRPTDAIDFTQADGTVSKIRLLQLPLINDDTDGI